MIYAVKRIKEKSEKSDQLKSSVELIRRRLLRDGSSTKASSRRSSSSEGRREETGFDRLRSNTPKREEGTDSPDLDSFLQ